MRLEREDLDGSGFFFGDGEVFAQAADGDDELLQDVHGVDAGGVGGEVCGLREAGEGDGFCGDVRAELA